MVVTIIFKDGTSIEITMDDGYGILLYQYECVYLISDIIGKINYGVQTRMIIQL